MRVFKKALLGCMVALTASGMLLANNMITSKASHTHIWAKTKDSSKHWEYCTECGEKRNVEEHKAVKKYWQKGKETVCGDLENPCYELCKCGELEKTYNQCDGTRDKIIQHENKIAHYVTCEHGAKNQYEKCKDKNGKEINCTNPGECVKCKRKVTSDSHYINYRANSTIEKCENCKKEFLGATLHASADMNNKKVKFTIVFRNIDPKVTLNVEKFKLLPNEMVVNAPELKWEKMDGLKDGEVGFTATGDLVLAYEDYSEPVVDSSKGFMEYNGERVYYDKEFWINLGAGGYGYTANIIDVNVKPLGTSNGWTTINEIVVSGKTEVEKALKVGIVDVDNGQLIEESYGIVENNKFKISFTSALAAPEKGKLYMAILSTKDGYECDKFLFEVKKTKCTPYYGKNDYITLDEHSPNKYFYVRVPDEGKGQLWLKNKNGSTENIELTKKGNFYETKITYDLDKCSNKDDFQYTVCTKDNTCVEWIDVHLRKCSLYMVDLFTIWQIKETKEDYTYCGYYSSLLKKNLVVKPVAEKEKYEFIAITTTETMPGINDWEYVDATLLSIKQKGEYYVWGMTECGIIGEIVKVTIGEDLKLPSGNNGKEIITIDKNYFTLGEWKKTTRTEADKKALFTDDMVNDSFGESESMPDDQNNLMPENNNNTLENDKETLENNNQNDIVEKEEFDEIIGEEEEENKDNKEEKDIFDITPGTGDELNLGLLVGGMIVSIIVGIIVTSIKRRRRFY